MSQKVGHAPQPAKVAAAANSNPNIYIYIKKLRGTLHGGHNVKLWKECARTVRGLDCELGAERGHARGDRHPWSPSCSKREIWKRIGERVPGFSFRALDVPGMTNLPMVPRKKLKDLAGSRLGLSIWSLRGVALAQFRGRISLSWWVMPDRYSCGVIGPCVFMGLACACLALPLPGGAAPRPALPLRRLSVLTLLRVSSESILSQLSKASFGKCL